MLYKISYLSLLVGLKRFLLPGFFKMILIRKLKILFKKFEFIIKIKINKKIRIKLNLISDIFNIKLVS